MYRAQILGLTVVVWWTSLLTSCTLDFSDFKVLTRSYEPSKDECGDGTLDDGELCDPEILEGVTGACPSPTSCAAAQGCERTRFVGDASKCTATCEVDLITDFVAGDKCCPKGASFEQDSDCSKECGDGLLGGDEQCDDSAGVPCPATEEDCAPKECQLADLSGDHCTTTCTYASVAPRDDDQCCPPGANSRTDNDCQPRCENGIVEEGEFCDPKAPDGCPQNQADCDERFAKQACRVGKFVAGTDNECQNNCVAETITDRADNDGCCPEGADDTNDNDCVGGVCGNNRVEPGEYCDIGPRSPFPCPAECAEPADKCVKSVLRGSECTAKCETVVVPADDCGENDGCCPDGCTASTDADCPPVTACGDGVVDEDIGEFCEGDCPTECEAPALGTCASSRLLGQADNCTARCITEPVTICSVEESDGVCCATSCDATNDIDCMPVCGNNIAEGEETCDGDGDGEDSCAAISAMCVDDGNPCTTATLSGSVGMCDLKCTIADVEAGPSDDCCIEGSMVSDPDCGCVPGVPDCCGNGVTEGDELCDGDCPSPDECTDLTTTYRGSPETCNAECFVLGLIPVGN